MGITKLNKSCQLFNILMVPLCLEWWTSHLFIQLRFLGTSHPLLFLFLLRSSSSQYTVIDQISVMVAFFLPRPCSSCSSKSTAPILYWKWSKVKKTVLFRDYSWIAVCLRARVREIARAHPSIHFHYARVIPRKIFSPRGDSNRGPPGRRADALTVRPRRPPRLSK